MFTHKERSHKTVKFKKMEEVWLPNAKLKFCVDQLQNLNFIFNKRLEQDESVENLSVEKSIALAKSVTERLVQRLLCGAAQIDPRFTTKYLINNRIDQYHNTSTHLEYIVRLDSLSSPTLYDTDEVPRYEILENDKDCPAGYARIRLHSSTLKTWEEFVNSFGYLRRDRVQAKLVELLAQAASQEKPSSPLQVDESSMCGIPGKIVDPASLHYILKIPANEQVFYGPGGKIPRFPDTRDFRLAIVDEPNGIKLKVEFLSPALSNFSIKVTILVAVGVDSWPASSDFPSRISMGHADCLLYYKAAQTGMYLVGYGVHSSAWQIRLPAAEFVLLNHYSPNSTVRTILDILYEILNDINGLRRFQKPMSYKILNRYMLFTILLEELEESSRSPFFDMVTWSPIYLSTLILKLLDKTIARLTSEFQPNYFFKKANLLVNPGHLCDDDFVMEAFNVKNYMIRMFDECLMSNRGNEEFSSLLLSQETELGLLYRWRDLVDGLLPSSRSRGRRFGFAGSKNSRDVAHTHYTTRQMEYIALVINNMLKVKQGILYQHQNISMDNFQPPEQEDAPPLEDLIFILVTLLDQARDQYLAQPSPNILKNKAKIKTSYNSYVLKLVDLIRRDREMHSKCPTDLQDDLTMVKIIIKWLYKAMDHNKKYLAPILRPYLSNLFCTSHHVSYHLELIRDRLKSDELEAIGSFAKLVNAGTITPAQGLTDSIHKKWQWARDMLDMVEKNTLRLVFVQSRDKVYRHILTLPSYDKENEMGRQGSKTWNDHEKTGRTVRRRTTLPGRNYFNSLVNDSMKNGDVEVPQHEILKSNSPLTAILSKKHRRGQHRGAGDILKSMTTMHKLSVFQQATSTLPKEDQSKLIDIIENIHSAKAKRSLTKKWSSTLPHSSRISPQGEPVQKYTPKEESAGIKLISDEPTKYKKDIVRSDSLLGTSRAARLREDNNVFLLHENFRIKCLINKFESFEGC